MTATPHDATEAARRIVARVETGWPIWNQFDRDAVTLARWVMKPTDAEWRPLLAGGCNHAFQGPDASRAGAAPEAAAPELAAMEVRHGR